MDSIWVIIYDDPIQVDPLPVDFLYNMGDVGNVIEWNFSDSVIENPTYSVEIDGFANLTDLSWTSGNLISVDVDGLDEGLHYVIITVYDGYGGITPHMVTITVNADPIIVDPIPSDFQYDFGSTGNTIEWNVSDSITVNPKYNVEIDGELNPFDYNWNTGEIITIDIDDLAEGYHVIKIIIRDGYGGITSDEVMVTVNADPLIERTFSDIILSGTQSTYLTLTWNIIDPVVNPTSFSRKYDLFVNNSLNSSGYWHSETPINTEINGLVSGLYNISIFVYDGLGGYSTDTIFLKCYNTNIFDVPSSSLTFFTGSFNNITWKLKGLDLKGLNIDSLSYCILLNGEELDILSIIPSSSYNLDNEWIPGTDITVDISDLEMGQYNLTLLMENGMGGLIQISYIITIENIPLFTPQEVILIFIIVFLSILGVMVLRTDYARVKLKKLRSKVSERADEIKTLRTGSLSLEEMDKTTSDTEDSLSPIDEISQMSIPIPIPVPSMFTVENSIITLLKQNGPTPEEEIVNTLSLSEAGYSKNYIENALFTLKSSNVIKKLEKDPQNFRITEDEDVIKDFLVEKDRFQEKTLHEAFEKKILGKKLNIFEVRALWENERLRRIQAPKKIHETSKVKDLEKEDSHLEISKVEPRRPNKIIGKKTIKDASIKTEKEKKIYPKSKLEKNKDEIEKIEETKVLRKNRDEFNRKTGTFIRNIKEHNDKYRTNKERSIDYMNKRDNVNAKVKTLKSKRDQNTFKIKDLNKKLKDIREKENSNRSPAEKNIFIKNMSELKKIDEQIFNLEQKIITDNLELNQENILIKEIKGLDFRKLDIEEKIGQNQETKWILNEISINNKEIRKITQQIKKYAADSQNFHSLMINLNKENKEVRKKIKSVISELEENKEIADLYHAKIMLIGKKDSYKGISRKDRKDVKFKAQKSRKRRKTAITQIQTDPNKIEKKIDLTRAKNVFEKGIKEIEERKHEKQLLKEEKIKELPKKKNIFKSISNLGQLMKIELHKKGEIGRIEEIARMQKIGREEQNRKINEINNKAEVKRKAQIQELVLKDQKLREQVIIEPNKIIEEIDIKQSAERAIINLIKEKISVSKEKIVKDLIYKGFTESAARNSFIKLKDLNIIIYSRKKPQGYMLWMDEASIDALLPPMSVDKKMIKKVQILETKTVIQKDLKEIEEDFTVIKKPKDKGDVQLAKDKIIEVLRTQAPITKNNLIKAVSEIGFPTSLVEYAFKSLKESGELKSAKSKPIRVKFDGDVDFIERTKDYD
ncbi:MAG: hypothetical protein GY870_15055 [archaeon]|nr:hypothetical protein [archaeon]